MATAKIAPKGLFTLAAPGNSTGAEVVGAGVSGVEAGGAEGTSVVGAGGAAEGTSDVGAGGAAEGTSVVG
jgi:hypothetical protein